MSDSSPFNVNQDWVAMKQDIADRAYKVKLKGMLIAGAFAAVGFGALFLFPMALGAATPLVGLLGVAGSAIAGLVTMKEAKKLEIDEQYLETRMQGGNWWGGYRQEVLQHGGQAAAVPVIGTPNPQQWQR